MNLSAGAGVICVYSSNSVLMRIGPQAGHSGAGFTGDAREDEERFLAVQADTFAGSERQRKAVGLHRSK
jgi:hypothetical protein